MPPKGLECRVHSLIDASGYLLSQDHLNHPERLRMPRQNPVSSLQNLKLKSFNIHFYSQRHAIKSRTCNDVQRTNRYHRVLGLCRLRPPRHESSVETSPIDTFQSGSTCESNGIDFYIEKLIANKVLIKTSQINRKRFNSDNALATTSRQTGI